MKKSEDGGTKGKQIVKRTTAKHRPLVSVAVRFAVFTRVGIAICFFILSRTGVTVVAAVFIKEMPLTPKVQDEGEGEE